MPRIIAVFTPQVNSTTGPGCRAPETCVQCYTQTHAHLIHAQQEIAAHLINAQQIAAHLTHAQEIHTYRIAAHLVHAYIKRIMSLSVDCKLHFWRSKLQSPPLSSAPPQDLCK